MGLVSEYIGLRGGVSSLRTEEKSALVSLLVESSPVHKDDEKLLGLLSAERDNGVSDYDSAMRIAEKMRMPKLGAGSFATAFSHPYDRKKAVRITREGDRCWIRFVGYLKNHKSRYFPTIHAHQNLFNGGAITIVERLYEFDAKKLVKRRNFPVLLYLSLTTSDYERKFRKRLTSKEMRNSLGTLVHVKKWIDELPTPTSASDGWSSGKTRIAINELLQSKIPFFVILRHIVAKTKCKLDLHPGNLMHKPDGSLVINDPVAWPNI